MKRQEGWNAFGQGLWPNTFAVVWWPAVSLHHMILLGIQQWQPLGFITITRLAFIGVVLGDPSCYNTVQSDCCNQDKLIGVSRKQGISHVIKGLTITEGMRWVFRGWTPSSVRLGPYGNVDCLEQHGQLFRYFKEKTDSTPSQPVHMYSVGLWMTGDFLRGSSLEQNIKNGGSLWTLEPWVAAGRFPKAVAVGDGSFAFQTNYYLSGSSSYNSALLYHPPHPSYSSTWPSCQLDHYHHSYLLWNLSICCYIYHIFRYPPQNRVICLEIDRDLIWLMKYTLEHAGPTIQDAKLSSQHFSKT